ncbi:MAG: Stp1/IreP family PP2C-type Ser/Thr phosphatase [Geobacteraceae bacterium]|nr:Stp1/IreP family PP2C-type Ser/Thr phosphatase [Geobacteraceae bacterium]
MSLNCLAAGLSDKGMVRDGNEDSILVAPDLNLYVVADGMGGHNAGEIASKMAVDVLRDYISRTAAGGEVLIGRHDQSVSDTANHLASGIKLANRVIYESAQSNPAWKNMGSTIVAVLLEDERLSIAHAGDSRAYLIRGESIIQLTDDHSLVAEQVRKGLISREDAETSTRRNIITRGLGVDLELEVDLSDLPVTDGDRILLCSDGLSNMLTDQAIAAITQGYRDPLEVCQKLIEEANRSGGTDNISAVIIMISGRKMSGLSRMFNWARSS